MKKVLACSLISMVLIAGCTSSKQVPRELVIVPDVSASIDPGAERQMFAAIEDVAQHLHRGDSLAIIPITGDAEAELQGRTLHYAVPALEDRQAYDSDIRTLNAQIKEDLAHLQADAIAHPGKHTDIIGSICAAMNEFSGRPDDKRLIVLSDFIQDDAQFNFRRDSRLTTTATAYRLAHDAAWKIPGHPLVKIVLGRIRSGEFSGLSPNRQRSIDSFWESLLSSEEIHPDGPEILRQR